MYNTEKKDKVGAMPTKITIENNHVEIMSFDIYTDVEKGGKLSKDMIRMINSAMDYLHTHRRATVVITSVGEE